MKVFHDFIEIANLSIEDVSCRHGQVGMDTGTILPKMPRAKLCGSPLLSLRLFLANLTGTEKIATIFSSFS